MFKEDHLSFRQRKYMKVKNIIGRALGGIGLVVLSPVYLAIIVAIKKEDGITAPVFFSQKRVGIHKEYFNLYKFRSMRTDTPHDKPTHLLENPDQYITKVGHFLRKSSLDELPQLWNIARGDMAVIGPRPALWNQDDLIAERDKYGANDVKPGLTGWAQINGRDELEIPVKARLDGEYVKKMGPLMDIRCFIGTVFSVLRSDGVVEGGTGAKKKLMVITNHSYMLWQFRRELIGKLMEDYDVIISTPFVGHEDDFKAMGCTMIETDVDRRGINPKTDMKLYLTYRRLLKEHHPDMVVTYSIKPNVYAGYACRQMRIPYCVNVQGLGTAFQKKGLREIVIRMYKTALKKAKTVYFENKGNAKVFLQEQIIRREQMCLLKGAGVNLKYYTYQKYPENDKVHFLYLGRIMKEKGMDELFYAVKELQRKEVPLSEAITNVKLPKERTNENGSLHVIFGGAPDRENSLLIGSGRMRALIKDLKSKYDIIILDTAPSELLADAPLLGKYVDAALYVIRYDYTKLREIREGVESLALSGIDMLGYVFNGDNSSGGQGYGYGYRRYGNYGSYGSHYGSYGKYGAYGHYGKMEKGSTDKFGRVIKD